MYTIDTIPFENYGLFISSSAGISHLPEMKQQFYTVYGAEGYQITTRTAKTLELNGFIIAEDIADFMSKCDNLRGVFSSQGIRTIVLNNGAINCFAKDGFKVDNVKVRNQVFAKFEIKLTVV